MTNFMPPIQIPKFDTWKCPKCGHTEEYIGYRKFGGSPIPTGVDFLTDLLCGKEKHKCPKCGTKMVMK